MKKDERIGKEAVINVQAGTVKPGCKGEVVEVMGKGTLLKIKTGEGELLLKETDVTVIKSKAERMANKRP